MFTIMICQETFSSACAFVAGRPEPQPSAIELLLMCPGNGRVLKIISMPLSGLFKTGDKDDKNSSPK